RRQSVKRRVSSWVVAVTHCRGASVRVPSDTSSSSLSSPGSERESVTVVVISGRGSGRGSVGSRTLTLVGSAGACTRGGVMGAATGAGEGCAAAVWIRGRRGGGSGSASARSRTCRPATDRSAKAVMHRRTTRRPVVARKLPETFGNPGGGPRGPTERRLGSDGGPPMLREGSAVGANRPRSRRRLGQGKGRGLNQGPFDKDLPS